MITTFTPPVQQHTHYKCECSPENQNEILKGDEFIKQLIISYSYRTGTSYRL